MRDETVLSRSREQGYTLVEILVALAIAGIVISGAYRSLSRITSSTNTEQLVLDMQMNVRNASFMISRDIRNAGYWGCAGGAAQLAANTLNNSNTNIAFSSNPVSWLNDYNDIANAYKANTDVVSLGFSDPDTASIGITPMSGNTAAITLNAIGFIQYDFIVISDCTRYSILQKTNAAGITLEHNAGGATVPGNSTTNIGFTYNLNATAYKMTKHTYYLDFNTGNTDMLLMMRSPDSAQDNPIADHIEDLQFQYGWDQNQDGTIANAEYADNPAATNVNDIQVVRIFILGRTTWPVDGYSDNNYYNYPNSPYFDPSNNTYGSTNGPGVHPGDRYRRYLVATMVTLRNKAM